MVTVTFPSRPQIAPPQEPPARAAPDPSRRAFGEVFDLLQPEGSAPAAPQSPDAPVSLDRTGDPSDPSADAPEQRLARDLGPDPTQEPTIAIGPPLLASDPLLERVQTEDALPEGDEEQQKFSPPSPGVPVLQAMMILTTASPDAPSVPLADPLAEPSVNPVAQPVDDRTAPAPAIPLSQGAAPVPAAVIIQPPRLIQPPSLASAAVPSRGEPSSPAPVPTVKATEEPGLFIMAEPAADSARKPAPKTGVPPFWAAREVADPDAAAPDGPDPVQHDKLPRDAVAPRPVVEPRMDPAAAQPEAETAMSFAGEEPSAQREAKPGPVPAPLQALVGGSSQAAPAPAAPQASVPLTLPPQIPPQIAAALAARPERPLELRLAPVELGGLTLNMLQDGEILRVVLQADRPETLDLLRRNGDILLEELRLAGFSGAALSFEDGGDGQNRPAPAPPRPAPVTELPAPMPLASTQRPAPAQTAQGLDLRL